ncbi:MAG TPA: hypothetical protein VGZ92_14725, partial [Bradyrhizobium sp.]|nr:hypothetical protein [Bradyrhizobium sp.]
SIDTTSSRTSGNSVDWYRDWPVTCAIMPSNQNPLPCYTNSLFHTVWKSGYPVRRGLSINHQRLWNTGSSAFADDDSGVLVALVPLTASL